MIRCAARPSRLVLILPAALLLVLSACAPGVPPAAESPAQAPTAGLDYPAPESQPAMESYPAPGTAEPAATAAGPEESYPSGLMGAPAVKNASRLRARILEITPDAGLPGFSRLRVQVLEVEEIAGMPSFTRGLENQEIDLNVETGALGALAVGDAFTAEIEYRGDERGGAFFATGPVTAVP